MAWRCENDFAECLERLEWEVHRLEIRDREWESSNQKTRAKQDRSSRAERAFSFVFIAAALEDLFRALDQDLVHDLRALRLRPHNLRPESLSMLFPEVWESTGGDRVIRLERRRMVVLAVSEFYTGDDVLSLEGLTHLGVYDGRTVRSAHFEALWAGLCLAGETDSVWLSPNHKTAVETIAKKRNSIAHFEDDPRDEAFRFTYGDLALRCRHVLETVERVQEHTIVWLDRHATG